MRRNLIMALLGGVRYLFGPVLGAVIVGVGLEYFKLEFGDTQFHLVAAALLLGIVVLFMPDGIIPAVLTLIKRFGPQESSIREVTAGELLERNRPGSPPAAAGPPAAAVDEPTAPTPGEDR